LERDQRGARGGGDTDDQPADDQVNSPRPLDHIAEHALGTHLSLSPHHTRRFPHVSLSLSGKNREHRTHRAEANPMLVLAVLCLGFFMILLDTNIVNVAIPQMSKSLGATLDEILWVLNAYVLVFAALLVVAGRLGDVLGQRTMFAVGIVIFAGASAGCGASPDVEHVIFFRVLQGIGGALLTPQTLAILVEVFPPERRGAAFGIWGAVSGLALVIGPTLGGLIVTNLSWRWIFYVNLPVELLALIGTFLFVPNFRHREEHGFDIAGVLVAVAGLFLLAFGLTEGQRYNWGTYYNLTDTPFSVVTIPQIIGAGVVLLVFFVFLESRQKQPLMPLRLFRLRSFAVMSLVGAIISIGIVGLLLPLTIYLQIVLGMSALQAGLAMAPLSLAAMVVAPFAGQLAGRIGGKYVLMVGLILFAAGIAAITEVATPTSTWLTILVPLIVGGIGFGCTFAPMATVAMQEITHELSGAASGVLNTMRQVGSVLAAALLGGLLQNRMSVELPKEAAARADVLPQPAQQPFVDAFGKLSSQGFQLGSSSSTASAPPGVPADVAAQISKLATDVFNAGFISAMRPVMLVGAGALLVGAVSCLVVTRAPRLARQPSKRSVPGVETSS
jgi:EmrB/QacA subfamily drug resistance transporter